MNKDLKRLALYYKLAFIFLVLAIIADFLDGLKIYYKEELVYEINLCIANCEVTDE